MQVPLPPEHFIQNLVSGTEMQFSVYHQLTGQQSVGLFEGQLTPLSTRESLLLGTACSETSLVLGTANAMENPTKAARMAIESFIV